MREETIKNTSIELYDILKNAENISDLESVYYTEEFKNKLKSIFAIATLEKSLAQYEYNYSKGSSILTDLDMNYGRIDRPVNQEYEELLSCIDEEHMKDYYIVRSKIFDTLNKIRIRRFNDIDNIIYNRNCIDNSVFKDSKTFSDRGFYESYRTAYNYLLCLLRYELRNELEDSLFFEYSFLIDTLMCVCSNILISEYESSLMIGESSSIEMFNYLVLVNYKDYSNNRFITNSCSEEFRMDEVKSLLSEIKPVKYNNVVECEGIQEYVDLCASHNVKASITPDIILFSEDNHLHLVVDNVTVSLDGIEDLVINLLESYDNQFIIACVTGKSFDYAQRLSVDKHFVIDLVDYIDSNYGEYNIDYLYCYPLIYSEIGVADICKITEIPGKRTMIKLI